MRPENIMNIAPSKKVDFPFGIYESSSSFYEIVAYEENGGTGLVCLMGYSLCRNCGGRIKEEFELSNKSERESDYYGFCSLKCVSEFCKIGDWYYRSEKFKDAMYMY